MKTTTKKSILIIALLALVSMMIAPACAETLTGQVGSTGWQSVNYDFGNAGGAYWPMDYGSIRIVNVEYIVQPVTLLHFDNGSPSVYSGTWSGEGWNRSVRFNMTYGSQVIATGTFGFQRVWTGFPSVEQPGYQYFIFDTWNNTGLSGTIRATINYQDSAGSSWADLSQAANAPPTNAPTGRFEWGCYNGGGGYVYNAGGLMTLNTNTPFLNDWTATKPSGIGIEGSVIKSVGGTTYNSQPYVYNAITNTLVASQSSVTGTTYNFSVPSESIYLAILDPYGVYHNTSTLFTSTIPTSTPTPTVTPTPTTTIPAGYIVTYFRTFDPLGNAEIHGTNISLYDVEAATWTNYSADADGRGEIYTLPYHTVNAIGHYPTAGIYNDGTLNGVDTGYSGGSMFYLDMYPYTPAPATGYTELYTTVRDNLDKSPILHASIGITTISTGAVYGTNTGNTGVSVDTFPNNTALRIEVTKSGYEKAIVATNTGTGPTKYIYVDLTRATVTPTITATPVPGELTPRPTVDPNDPSNNGGDTGPKAQEMMNWLSMNGMTLVQLCFIATVLGIVSMMAKK